MTDSETQRLRLRGEIFVVAWSALLVSLFALSFSYSRSLMLLYGDAVAHLHIARRIIDPNDDGQALQQFISDSPWQARARLCSDPA